MLKSTKDKKGWLLPYLMALDTMFFKRRDYRYRTFNRGLFYKEPADHWPDLAMGVMGKNNPLGFFSTPANVVEIMVRMQFGGEPQHRHKRMSVLDPACGAGNMRFYASNYSLNLYGQDISLLLTKIAKINVYIYMPWMMYKPKHLTVFESHITE